MRFGVPDWLRYEIRHKLEQLHEGFERLHVKNAINDHPKAAAIIALLVVVLLWTGVAHIVRKPPGRHRRESKKAWFYDLNTGRLFVGSGKEIGPVKAPSGPLPNGEPAGYRAHVCSFLRDPNESERFVAFLEKPDPNSSPAALTWDPGNLEEWAKGRLIKRVGGDEWVSPTSPRGRQIIQELTHPNVYGQIPINQVPR
ncbi:MAG: hypothetical protein JSW27_19685 [Phycisphaerales bacterium]|nr:MAG: hypothetical protein JSW27_19685 [Phycisphaerales bacterium]